MKLIIDIPDNELKNPLKNIHLLIDNGIVTEVCIKKYDKDRPYFMDLNYAPLEECDDCISRQAAIDAIKKLHTIEAEYDCILYEKLDVLYELEDLPLVKPAEKVGQWIVKGESWYCSRCNEPICEIYDGKPYEEYCPNCGAKMRKR